MRIKWLGHSCFKMSTKNGIRVVTDPFDDNVGYKLPTVETDVVTMSHGHYDHNFVDCVKGNFEVVTKVGNFYVKDIPISGVQTFHDEENGQKRGTNIVYIFEMDGVRVCHLGDLGHILTSEQVDMIGEVDVLLIPVGGVFTIDGEKAIEVVNQLKPAIVIPMHYKTPALKLQLESVDRFIELMGKEVKTGSRFVQINTEDLDKDNLKIYVLNYE